MGIIFHSHANKTHFHKKGCAPSLILKVKVFGTGKWPIAVVACKPVACVAGVGFGVAGNIGVARKRAAKPRER